MKHFVMLNLFQHLVQSNRLEIPKQVRDDVKMLFQQPANGWERGARRLFRSAYTGGRERIF
jgi:hypothetical protein